MFVLDASVTMAWCFPDEVTAYTEGVLDQLRQTGALVPLIWPLEVANVLVIAERRQRLVEVQTVRFVQLLHSLPIAVSDDSVDHVLGRVLELARLHKLSSYDAVYVELAVRKGLPLATNDRRIGDAVWRATPLATLTAAETPAPGPRCSGEPSSGGRAGRCEAVRTSPGAAAARASRRR